MSEDLDVEKRKANWARSADLESKRMDLQEWELARAKEAIAENERHRDSITQWYRDAPARHADQVLSSRRHTDELVTLIKEQNGLLARIVAVLERAK